MNAERAAAIRALLDATTPGPWAIQQYRTQGADVWRLCRADDPEAIVFDCTGVWYEGGGVPPSESDAAFIAAAPTIIRELLAENERLQRALADAVVIATTETQTY